jgi:hypothetical protein
MHPVSIVAAARTVVAQSGAACRRPETLDLIINSYRFNSVCAGSAVSSVRDFQAMGAMMRGPPSCLRNM